MSTVPPPGRKGVSLEDALFLQGLDCVRGEAETEDESGFRIADVAPEKVRKNLRLVWRRE